MAEIDSRCGRWDHPRRCGENDGRRICTKFDKGSPPQVRGKPDNRPWQGTVCGITPAGAGKTFSAFGRNCGNWDHPRRCGENIITAIAEAAPTGSPPQVRGKPVYCWTAGTAPRITPAGAGKTRKTRTPMSTTPDHPRRCGENPNSKTRLTASLGSPPQVRGKHNGHAEE